MRLTIATDYPGELLQKQDAVLARVRASIAEDAEAGADLRTCGTCYAHAGLAERCLLHGRETQVTARHVCDYHVHGPGFAWSAEAADLIAPLRVEVSGLRLQAEGLAKGTRSPASRWAQAGAEPGTPADQRSRKLRDRPLQDAREVARVAVDEVLRSVEHEIAAIIKTPEKP